jgi:hypothetical protein
MKKLSDPKSVIHRIAIGFFLIVVIGISPWLYQQGKDLGAELYRATQGGCKSSSKCE